MNLPSLQNAAGVQVFSYKQPGHLPRQAHHSPSIILHPTSSYQDCLCTAVQHCAVQQCSAAVKCNTAKQFDTLLHCVVKLHCCRVQCMTINIEIYIYIYFYSLSKKGSYIKKMHTHSCFLEFYFCLVKFDQRPFFH